MTLLKTDIKKSSMTLGLFLSVNGWMNFVLPWRSMGDEERLRLVAICVCKMPRGASCLVVVFVSFLLEWSPQTNELLIRLKNQRKQMKHIKSSKKQVKLC